MSTAPKLPLADAAALIARAISYEAAGDAAAYADAIRALDEGRGRFIDGQWWGGTEMVARARAGRGAAG